MNDTETCPDRAWYAAMGEKASYFAYYICSPAYFVLGALCHGLCLKAFYIQSKKEQAYAYQIYTTLSEALEVFSWFVYVAGFVWVSDIGNHWAHWYHTCYVCMWFTAIMGTTLINITITTSELFSLCMSADRLYALWKPFLYKNTNARRNQVVALVTCVLVGVFTSIQQCWVFGVQAAPGTNPTFYELVGHFDLGWINVAIVIRNLCQAATLIALYGCNVALVWFFRLRQIETAALVRETSKEKRRREAEKTLALLTIAQCTCMTLSTTSTIIFHTVVFFWPSFYTCTGPFYMPLRDAYLQIIDLLDFLFVILISKQFRNMILTQLPCNRSTTVVPSSSLAAANASGQGRQQGVNVSRPNQT